MTEKKTKWTPGPWLREGVTVYALYNFQGVMRNRFSACFSHCFSGASAEEIQANAQLAESAPELYAALADVFKLIEEEFLVRNTSSDNDSAWAINCLPKVQRLAKDEATLRRAQSGE